MGAIWLPVVETRVYGYGKVCCHDNNEVILIVMLLMMVILIVINDGYINSY